MFRVSYLIFLFAFYRDEIIIKPKFAPPAYLLDEVCITVKGATSVTFTLMDPSGNVLLEQKVCLDCRFVAMRNIIHIKVESSIIVRSRK